MSATIHRLPTRPAPRLAEVTRPVPSLTLTNFDQELRHIAMSLHEASGHFGMLATEPLTITATTDGADALEEALFHALTLKGCRNIDKPLRDMLIQRHMAREVQS